ncbi:hypothetical protein, partial [Pseudomonas aeruginosa]|uniref:hypothetical protein n=1 Tax=Pseudomonas aeruginosa TaxID=287 RepID=UPI003CC5B746
GENRHHGDHRGEHDQHAAEQHNPGPWYAESAPFRGESDTLRAAFKACQSTGLAKDFKRVAGRFRLSRTGMARG